MQEGEQKHVKRKHPTDAGAIRRLTDKAAGKITKKADKTAANAQR
jgi:hypothetical protein